MIMRKKVFLNLSKSVKIFISPRRQKDLVLPWYHDHEVFQMQKKVETIKETFMQRRFEELFPKKFNTVKNI